MTALPADTRLRGARRVPAREPVAPHIEIAPSRAQRRARPRLVAAVVTVGGLFGILAGQLLLTIATSEGAYEIASLQSAQLELGRDQQVLQEGIRVLQAPQHLAAEAQGMGMVPNSGAAQLRLSDGAVLGTPVASTANSANITAPDGTPLIPNSLLADTPLVGAASIAATAAGETGPVTGVVPGAPAVPAPDPSLPSTPAGIPTPVTH